MAEKSAGMSEAAPTMPTVTEGKTRSTFAMATLRLGEGEGSAGLRETSTLHKMQLAASAGVSVYFSPTETHPFSTEGVEFFKRDQLSVSLAGASSGTIPSIAFAAMGPSPDGYLVTSGKSRTCL